MEFSDWSPVERELAAGLMAGTEVDLTGREHRTVRASVIRRLMLGQWPDDLDANLPKVSDPQGLRLYGAIIDGRIDLDFVRSATRLELIDVTMSDGMSLVGSRLPDVVVSGVLGPSIEPAFEADAAIVELRVDLRGSTITSSSEDGSVRLVRAHVGAQLSMIGANLTNDRGPALHADGATVDNNAYLDLTATGYGDVGAVCLRGAHIGGQLSMVGANLINDAGPALSADGLTVDSDAHLKLAATGHGDLGTVRLLGAHVGGQLDMTGTNLTNSLSLVIDGLTYQGIPSGGVDGWLTTLRSTVTYAAQPYRQLAGATAAAGHDADTRKILMAQRKDQLTRATSRRRDKFWGWLTGWTLGYGYQPWRALVLLVAVTAASAVLTVVVGTHSLHLKDSSTPCSVAERAIIGLDNALPLVTTTVSATCVTPGSPDVAGQAVTGIGIGAQVAGWAFATLFVAGFTGAVRKT